MRRITAKPLPAAMRAGGFAMVLVLVLVVTGVVLGVSYLSVASIHLQVTRNYNQAARARYLAESGLEHAIHILRTSPEQLDGSVASPLGPYYVDDTPDGYTISAQENPGLPGQYVLTSTATIGNIRRTSSMTVYRSDAPTIKVSQAMLVGAGAVSLPQSVTINGDVRVNDSLVNHAYINGKVSSTNTVSDPAGRITGTIQENAGEIILPNISADQYYNYSISGTDYAATVFEKKNLTRNDPLANGGAITAGNVGGVVHLTPRRGNTVQLHNNLNFIGTLVIDGNVLLRGPDITLTAVDGFPAIVATGSVIVSTPGKNITINGLVVTGQGFVPGRGNSRRTRTTINGAVTSATKGYDPGLKGVHTINYEPSFCEIFDFSPSRGSVGASVTVLRWND